MNGSISEFYGEKASLYDVVSQDRDFAAQAAYLALAVARQAHGGRILELFAGPARHSIALEARHSYICSAIDASVHMKTLATRPGGLHPDRYFIATLPDLPEAVQRGDAFQGATVLRYSAGYLGPVAVVEMLRQLSHIIAAKGRVIFELHDLELLRDDFKDFAIRERVVDRGDGTNVRCVWPAGPLRWRRSDWIVEMDVLLEERAGHSVLSSQQFVSVERIYASREMSALATLAGGWRPVQAHSAAFAGSELLILERN